jgi:hypothetical protein
LIAGVTDKVHGNIEHAMFLTNSFRDSCSPLPNSLTDIRRNRLFGQKVIHDSLIVSFFDGVGASVYFNAHGLIVGGTASWVNLNPHFESGIKPRTG